MSVESSIREKVGVDKSILQQIQFLTQQMEPFKAELEQAEKELKEKPDDLMQRQKLQMSQNVISLI